MEEALCAHKPPCAQAHLEGVSYCAAVTVLSKLVCLLHKSWSQNSWTEVLLLCQGQWSHRSTVSRLLDSDVITGNGQVTEGEEPVVQSVFEVVKWELSIIPTCERNTRKSCPSTVPHWRPLGPHRPGCGAATWGGLRPARFWSWETLLYDIPKMHYDCEENSRNSIFLPFSKIRIC